MSGCEVTTPERGELEAVERSLSKGFMDWMDGDDGFHTWTQEPARSKIRAKFAGGINGVQMNEWFGGGRGQFGLDGERRGVASDKGVADA